jgi:elongation factor P
MRIRKETQGVHVIVIDGAPVGLDLPSSVELVVEETDPSIKGASASARSKPARMSTGLNISVPEHISTGDRIRINTVENKFMGRAEK